MLIGTTKKVTHISKQLARINNVDSYHSITSIPFVKEPLLLKINGKAKAITKIIMVYIEPNK